MLQLIKNLNVNKKLALAAFAFGFLALFAGSPFNNTYSKVNAKDLALASSNGQDLINVSELADAIMKGYVNFRVIDVRSEDEYKKYFIPGAQNIPIGQLTEAGLKRNEKILLYDDDNLTASQAWFILKTMDYKGVYILKGGLNEWKGKILFPKLSANASPEEKEAFAKVSEISKFFGGVPQIGGQAVSDLPVELPKVQAPPPSTGGSAKRKKREGC